MAFGFRTNALAPAGLVVDPVKVEADAIEVCIRSPARSRSARFARRRRRAFTAMSIASLICPSVVDPFSFA